MLEKVRYADHANGVEVGAFTDGYAYDEYSCLYLLSAAGRESSVKAITSAVVSGRTIEICSDRVLELGAPFGRHCRILNCRLPDGPHVGRSADCSAAISHFGSACRAAVRGLLAFPQPSRAAWRTHRFERKACVGASRQAQKRTNTLTKRLSYPRQQRGFLHACVMQRLTGSSGCIAPDPRWGYTECDLRPGRPSRLNHVHGRLG